MGICLADLPCNWGKLPCCLAALHLPWPEPWPSGGSCDWLLRFPDSAASAAAQASAAAPTAVRAARAARSAGGSASAARLRATCAAPGLALPHVLRRSYGDAVSALHGSRERVKFGARRFSVPYTKDLLPLSIFWLSDHVRQRPSCDAEPAVGVLAGPKTARWRTSLGGGASSPLVPTTSSRDRLFSAAGCACALARTAQVYSRRESVFVVGKRTQHFVWLRFGARKDGPSP